MTSPRDLAITEALAAMTDGEAVSLDSVARRAGLTKAGLMHYFPTKAALMLALVDYVVDRWETGLDALLATHARADTPAERVLMYLEWCLSSELDPSDLVMLADPRLRGSLTARWTDRFEPWFDIDPATPPADRARIDAVRLLADGVWFAIATGVMPPPVDEFDTIRSIARAILED